MKILKIIALLVILIAISYPINNHNSKKIEEELCSTPLPPNTVLVDSVSKSAKLVGNGNGIQYFGAISIKSELSMEELDEYYKQYRYDDWCYLIEHQEGTDIDVIEHGDLDFSSDDGNYIVYTWGEGNEFFELWDLRGH